MFLQPSEVGFLKHLKEARVPVVEFEFPQNKIVNVQSQLEKLIGQNYYLNKVCLSRPLPPFFFLNPKPTFQHPIPNFDPVRQGRISFLPPGLRLTLAALRL